MVYASSSLIMEAKYADFLIKIGGKAPVSSSNLSRDYFSVLHEPSFALTRITSAKEHALILIALLLLDRSHEAYCYYKHLANRINNIPGESDALKRWLTALSPIAKVVYYYQDIARYQPELSAILYDDSNLRSISSSIDQCPLAAVSSHFSSGNVNPTSAISNEHSVGSFLSDLRVSFRDKVFHELICQCYASISVASAGSMLGFENSGTNGVIEYFKVKYAGRFEYSSEDGFIDLHGMGDEEYEYGGGDNKAAPSDPLFDSLDNGIKSLLENCVQSELSLI